MSKANMEKIFPINSRREVFRKKLERLGVLEALNNALMVLYDKCDTISDHDTAMQLIAQALYTEEPTNSAELEETLNTLITKNIRMERYITKLKACFPSDEVPPQSDDEDQQLDESVTSSNCVQYDDADEDGGVAEASVAFMQQQDEINGSQSQATLTNDKCDVEIVEADSSDAVNNVEQPSEEAEEEEGEEEENVEVVEEVEKVPIAPVIAKDDVKVEVANVEIVEKITEVVKQEVQKKDTNCATPLAEALDVGEKKSEDVVQATATNAESVAEKVDDKAAGTIAVSPPMEVVNV